MEKKTKEQVWHEVNNAVDKGNLEVLREEVVRVDDVIKLLDRMEDYYNKPMKYFKDELSQSSPERTSHTLSVSEANLDNSGRDTFLLVNKNGVRITFDENARDDIKEMMNWTEEDLQKHLKDNKIVRR